MILGNCSTAEVAAAAKTLFALTPAAKAQEAPTIETAIEEVDKGLVAVIELEESPTLEVAVKELRNKFIHNTVEEIKQAGEVSTLRTGSATEAVEKSSSAAVTHEEPYTSEKIIWLSDNQKIDPDWVYNPNPEKKSYAQALQRPTPREDPG